MMSFADTLADIEAHNREIVYRETWGHLNSRPEVEHHGHVVFAYGIYGGDPVVTLSLDFGPDAGDGPWFYEGLQDWLLAQNGEDGKVYRFEGTYRLDRDGIHHFNGTTREMDLR